MQDDFAQYCSICPVWCSLCEIWLLRETSSGQWLALQSHANFLLQENSEAAEYSLDGPIPDHHEMETSGMSKGVEALFHIPA